MEISTTLVIGLGIGTVFICLVCLVIICYIMSAIVRVLKRNEKTQPISSQEKTAATSEIKNKGEFAAAVAAAIAEDLGTDVKGIRIKSIKKV